MTRYFGTDGIRGEANQKLTPELALKVGQYLGWKFSGKNLVIGKDTRLSSSMLENALAAGATSMGAHVYLMGVCATPALAYVVRTEDFAAGVMISASHNPFEDNGLKCFSHSGMKIDSSLEEEIESYIDGKIAVPYALPKSIGTVKTFKQGLTLYCDFLEATVKNSFQGMHIVLDLANGSAVSSAKSLFERLGATIYVMNDKPDGININTKAGSTHPEFLQEKVVELGADMGFAFDGDADRCIAVDHLGNLVDGDRILYVLGSYMKKDGSLKDETVVATVMSNFGFFKAMKQLGLEIKTTDVGDKYVLQEMVDSDYKLGGEQSGHVILKDYATAGDGVLTALKLAEVVVLENKTLHELGAGFVSFPQVLKNVPVSSKNAVMGHHSVLNKVKEVEKELGAEGRILVRSSGTEELVRVMVEASSEDLCHHYVDLVVGVIETLEV